MKDTFDKVIMDEDRKLEMRNAILAQREPAKVTWFGPVIGVAAAAAVTIILAVPASRSAVVSAADRIFAAFKSNDGTAVTMLEEADETAAQVDYSDEVEYAQLKDDRLYFVINDEWTDITDKCSNTDAFVYEINNDDGSREVIMVGGTPEEGKFGWWSLTFDPEGNCIWNHGSIPEALCESGDPLWMQKVSKAEGVSYNDGQYDYVLDSNDESVSSVAGN